MENCRTNEVLAAQIAIIQEFAVKLGTKDLRQLKADLGELERAMNTLKELVAYLSD